MIVICRKLLPVLVLLLPATAKPKMATLASISDPSLVSFSSLEANDRNPPFKRTAEMVFHPRLIGFVFALSLVPVSCVYAISPYSP